MEDLLKQLIEGQKQLFGEFKSIRNEMATKQDFTRMENNLGDKVSALFDGYTLRGEQIEHLKDHLDERLDSIQNDLSYVVGKVAQHDRNIVQLNKLAK